VKEKGAGAAAVIAIVIVIAAVAAIGGYYLGAGGEGGEEDGSEGPSAPHYEVIATVTSMVDGDTTLVRIENIVVELDPGGEVYEDTIESVRYGGGVDAPEMNWYNPERSQPGAVEATELVENLIPPGTTVYLDLDDNREQTPDGQGPYRGVYGRLIAVIYVMVDGQWINVNAELLRWGQEEYPSFDWLKYAYFATEFDADEWLEEDYPYVRG